MGRASSRPDGAAPSAADVRDGARALGLALSDAQCERLAAFAALLLRWNAVHNLTALRTADEVLSHHLLDSLAILPAIDAIFFENTVRILDVGAGGGLPGIPLAIARPHWHVTLVDKVQKKVAFLTQAKLELGLGNLDCVHARAEQLELAPVDLVISRAFAALDEFVTVSRHLVRAYGWWAAMKGGWPATELAALAGRCPDVRVVEVVKLAVPRLDADRHLVLLQRP